MGLLYRAGAKNSGAAGGVIMQAYLKPWRTNPDGSYLTVDFQLGNTDVRVNMLWWQRQHLLEMASGYGNKLRTVYQVFYEGRWRRVYCCCHGNIGTCYIIHNNEPVIVEVM